ncbi:ABC transporter substrate-binding protein [Actinoplanes sp. NPDC049265]|uniref:ABC transporter substrate-binding protein n=1 Tax=Actinoplanes sp. NPDC049265 TaxID=3363902 RepID=UPI0037185068
MPSRRKVLTSLVAASVTAGCGDSSPPTSTGKGLDQVTYLTGFGVSPRETYPHVGLSQGYFTEAGIDLTIRPGQPSDANLGTLAAGQAQFASVDFVSAVRGTKKFTDYRAVMAVQSSTLLSIITLDGRGITKPADLAGRKLGAAPAAASHTLFPTYARLAGLDPAAVTWIDSPADQLPSLLVSNRVDGIGSYAIDIPTIRTAAQGKTPVALPYGTYIKDLYGTVVVATRSVVDGDADLVRRFTGAMAKTVRFAVHNPAEAGRLVQAALPTVKGTVVAEVMGLMAPYVTEPTLDRGRVERSIGVLQKAGLAAPGLTPDQVVAFA